MKQKFTVNIRFIFCLSTKIMTSAKSLRNFSFGSHDVYHEEFLLFLKAIYFVFKPKQKEFDVQSLEKN